MSIDGILRHPPGRPCTSARQVDATRTGELAVDRSEDSTASLEQDLPQLRVH